MMRYVHPAPVWAISPDPLVVHPVSNRLQLHHGRASRKPAWVELRAQALALPNHDPAVVFTAHDYPQIVPITVVGLIGKNWLAVRLQLLCHDFSLLLRSTLDLGLPFVSRPRTLCLKPGFLWRQLPRSLLGSQIPDNLREGVGTLGGLGFGRGSPLFSLVPVLLLLRPCPGPCQNRGFFLLVLLCSSPLQYLQLCSLARSLLLRSFLLISLLFSLGLCLCFRRSLLTLCLCLSCSRLLRLSP
mmetsp:Transcript_67351/g.196901  ORF Transcript_67351/g.196901 Transcript_67351/m.196901 type:complete len:242 (-) Transcript_67351:211-936(-)